MVFDERAVRLLLAVGAAAALFGAFLQAITELSDYKDLIGSAKLTDAAERELLTQYTQVSYWVSSLLWGLIPFYGLYRNLYREPIRLIDKVFDSALGASERARAKTAVRKARNWLIIFVAASLVLVGSVLDLVNAIDSV